MTMDAAGVPAAASVDPAPPPGVRVRIRGFVVVIPRAALLGVVSVVATGYLLAQMSADLFLEGTTRPFPAALAWSLVFALLVWATMSAHEAAHAAAGAVCGHPPVWAVFRGFGAGVQLQGTPARWARVFVSSAGPLAEILAGLALLLTSWRDRSGPAAFVGAFATLNGAGNLLLPMGRNSDAVKLYRGIGQIASRRHHPKLDPDRSG